MGKKYICQPLTTIPLPTRRVGNSLIPFMPSIVNVIRRGLSLFLLGYAVPMWFTVEALAPQVVQAYTTRVNLSLDRLPDESYQNLIPRAEAMARAADQRSFDRDILVTDVSIIVSVQNQGIIVPIIALEVSRPQWRNNPEPRRWATYFRTARTLLFSTTPAKINNSETNNKPKTEQPTQTSSAPLNAASKLDQNLPTLTSPPQTR